MPRKAPAQDVAFERAALRIETALREALGGVPEQLDAAAVTAAYPTRRFVRGWRIEGECSDGVQRRVDLLLGSAFPAGYPRTALVDRPPHMTWPHIERDGILCLLPLMAEVDAENPGDVAANLVGRSFLLIEELLEGKIVDQDFREEFLTYWFYGTDAEAPRIYSMARPGPPSRAVRVWRDGKGTVIVGEDHTSLELWLAASRDAPAGRSWRTEPAALIWLEEPLLPSQYPVTAADLVPIAERAGDEALETLGAVAAALPEDVLVLMGAEGRGGPGLIGVTTTSARRTLSRTGRIEQPLTKGFRAQTMPADVAIARTYSTTPLLRSNVARADAAWIHGRGRDPRSVVLLTKTVTIVGCGSVGSSVAARLARAGVGFLKLYDPDDLSWSNVGRHELGGRSVGLNKAEALAKRLSADFPHLSIIGAPYGAHALTSLEPESLLESDLVLAATGSWQADGELNRWHVEEGRGIPFLYAWAETHASAGHAVVIGAEGGCLRCGVGPTGVPAFQATTWPDGGGALEEPACGNHFQPYGAVELGFVVDLVADAALETLLAPTARSREALWLTRADRLQANGGHWSSDIIGMFGEDFEGGRWTKRDWPVGQCPACGAVRLECAA